MTPEQCVSVMTDEIDTYVARSRPYSLPAKEAAANDPSILGIRHDPVRDRLVVQRTHGSPYGPSIAGLTTHYTSSPEADPSWCSLVLTQSIKTADFLQTLRGLTGWNDKYYPPSPLAAMIATGILGAGLGYGGASLASRFLPNNWDKKKFRRGGLLAGAGIGAAPGAFETLKSLLIGQPVLDGSHMEKVSSFTDQAVDTVSLLRETWRNPYVEQGLTPQDQMLLTGAAVGAQRTAGSPYITPRDMARLTAGMGSGYAAGLVAGKVLGTLTGMPQEAQNALIKWGVYAGVIKSVLPMIYGF